VDWDVGQGGIPATIMETGGTTATDCASITVRYETRSPTADEADTVWIQATKGGATGTKKRTVFKADWTELKFSGELNHKHNLKFPVECGTSVRQCAFNWPGHAPDDGATVVCGKMEATLTIEPDGIDWLKRKVKREYGYAPTNAKFGFRLHRQTIETNLAQYLGVPYRVISTNDEGWVWDGTSSPVDTANPSVFRHRNKAFRIDAPSFTPKEVKQLTKVADFRELAQWNRDGTEDGWCRITPWTNAEWHYNGTSVLRGQNENGSSSSSSSSPDWGIRGGLNEHGAGIPAKPVYNTPPVADAGLDKTVPSRAMVRLYGGGGDADIDPLVFYDWRQDAGPSVTLIVPDARSPYFKAPKGPATLVFSLRVTDQTTTLHHHKPDDSQSDPDTVTIEVEGPSSSSSSSSSTEEEPPPTSSSTPGEPTSSSSA